jgi:hypothetical protein
LTQVSKRRICKVWYCCTNFASEQVETIAIIMIYYGSFRTGFMTI